MRKLEPRTRKSISQLVGVIEEVSRDLLVCWIDAQRQVRSQHGRMVPLLWIVRIGNGVLAGVPFRLPLVRAGGAHVQIPHELEQRLEEAVVPLRRRRSPDAFQSARDRVRAYARLEAVLPAESHVFEQRSLWLRTHIARTRRAVRLAESMTTRDE